MPMILGADDCIDCILKGVDPNHTPFSGAFAVSFRLVRMNPMVKLGVMPPGKHDSFNYTESLGSQKPKTPGENEGRLPSRELAYPT